MPRAICEDCGSLVAAEVTHNGVCAVGHYVHCGWGHELHLDDLISDEAGEIVAGLEKRLAMALEALKHAKLNMPHPDQLIDDTLAELKGQDDE